LAAGNVCREIRGAIDLVLLALPGQARMYQWISPASGTTQLSGKPPSLGEGPRVIMFENGKIVDDTATRVPEWQRERMRAEAFGLPGGVKELAEKLREIANSKEFLGSLVEQAEELEQKKEEPGPSTVDQLKAVISAWDKLKLEQARTLVHDQDTPAPEDAA
jgi:hypothetical protein